MLLGIEQSANIYKLLEKNATNRKEVERHDLCSAEGYKRSLP